MHCALVSMQHLQPLENNPFHKTTFGGRDAQSKCCRVDAAMRRIQFLSCPNSMVHKLNVLNTLRQKMSFAFKREMFPNLITLSGLGQKGNELFCGTEFRELCQNVLEFQCFNHCKERIMSRYWFHNLFSPDLRSVDRVVACKETDRTCCRLKKSVSQHWSHTVKENNWWHRI